MTSLFRSAAACLFLTGIAARAADPGKPVPPRPSEAKVVDTPEMKAKLKPPEDPDWVYAHPEHGEAVQVRRAPAKDAPVFAHFAGGVDVEVYGAPVKRDGVLWADVDLLGVRGWVPKDRLSTKSKKDTSDRRWDIRFISPSGKVVVQFANPGIGNVAVIKDGTGREAYGLDLGKELNWSVSGMLLFSKDENCLALSYGGPSWGTDVFVYAREGNGPFKRLDLRLQDRCWEMALKEGSIPAGANPVHLYVAEKEPHDQGFVISLSGNYNGTGTGQTNFGPICFIWTWQGDKLELAK